MVNFLELSFNINYLLMYSTHIAQSHFTIHTYNISQALPQNSLSQKYILSIQYYSINFNLKGKKSIKNCCIGQKALQNIDQPQIQKNENHFFLLEPLVGNLIPSFTVMLLLLLVLHLDSFELEEGFLEAYLCQLMDDSLSSIPKYSSITLDYFGPSFGCYFVIEDKGIFSNSFKLLIFFIFNFPVDLFLFDFNVFYTFTVCQSFLLFFLPNNSSRFVLSYLQSFLRLQLLILLFDLEFASGGLAKIGLLIFLSLSYFFENNFFSDFCFFDGDLQTVFDFLRIQLLDNELSDLTFLILYYGLDIFGIKILLFNFNRLLFLSLLSSSCIKLIQLNSFQNQREVQRQFVLLFRIEDILYSIIFNRIQRRFN